MKRTFFLLLIAMLAFAAGAQDIILDPIETTPITPSARSLATGNWGYYQLQVPQHADEIKRRAAIGRPVVVYVFDTGGKWDHPGLAEAADNARGKSYTGEADPIDGNGHSTHVASSYAGRGASGEAVGVCSPLLDIGRIRLIPRKVLTNAGTGSFSWSAQAVRDANVEAAAWRAAGWFVIYNFSLGGGTSIVGDLEQALQSAKAAGVLVVCAAGNSGGEGVIYPAKSQYTEAIGALAQTNTGVTRAWFSTTGDEVTNALPGQSIYGCYKGSYAELSGTSMAAPHAGAVAALVAACWPLASAEQVSAHLHKYSTDLGDPGRDKLYGFGLPDLGLLLANDPGHGGGDPPTDPDPDPDPPTDPPGEFPVRILPVAMEQVHTVSYARMGERPKVMRFKIAVDYKTRKPSDMAAAELTRATREHFRSRGYITQTPVDEWLAAYWVAFFYEMILKEEGYDVDVYCVRIQGAGNEVCREVFEKPQRVKQRRATVAGVITYK